MSADSQIELRTRFIDAITSDNVIELTSMIHNGIILDSHFDIYNKNHFFPLHSAINCDNVQIVSLLIRAGANLDAQHGAVGGDSPLFAAVAAKNAQIVQLLIDSGADVNKSNHRGLTPLHAACSLGELGLAQLLIAQGANVNAKDRYNKSVSHLAVSHLATSSRIVELLVANGADIDTRDELDRAPCHYAAIYNHLETIKILIVAGANVQTGGGSSGVTCCHMAAKCGHVVMLKLLMAVGSDLSAVDADGRTPLEFIRSTGLPHVERLLETATSADQTTPAAIALRRELTQLQLDFIRVRATEICVALQSVELPALLTLAIIDFACAGEHMVQMHLKWKLITIIKHFFQWKSKNRRY